MGRDGSRRFGAAPRALRHALFGVALALVGLASCDLNPQPEVPSGAAGSGAFAGGGGSGGSSGGGGLGGSFDAAAGGMGGSTSGGAAGGTALDAGLNSCASPCKSGELCYAGSCVDDPCEPNNCSASQACKPNASFDAAGCFDSCAGVVCGSGEVCTDGKCQPTGCPGGCGATEVCAASADGGFACVADACLSDAASPCATGSICEPVAGTCVIDPCVGVKCPTGQECYSGECEWPDDSGLGDAATD